MAFPGLRLLEDCQTGDGNGIGRPNFESCPYEIVPSNLPSTSGRQDFPFGNRVAAVYRYGLASVKTKSGFLAARRTGPIGDRYQWYLVLWRFVFLHRTCLRCGGFMGSHNSKFRTYRQIERFGAGFAAGWLGRLVCRRRFYHGDRWAAEFGSSSSRWLLGRGFFAESECRGSDVAFVRWSNVRRR